jgi:H+/Cl- antiporter ClcA
MMTETTIKTKTFTRQPAWNSGAALGVIAGLIFGLCAPVTQIWMPWLQAFEQPWLAHIMTWAIIGGMIGALTGALTDRSAFRNRD